MTEAIARKVCARCGNGSSGGEDGEVRREVPACMLHSAQPALRLKPGLCKEVKVHDATQKQRWEVDDWIVT